MRLNHAWTRHDRDQRCAACGLPIPAGSQCYLVAGIKAAAVRGRPAWNCANCHYRIYHRRE